jgi:Dolichyl-phosphate-mannose-protein mannosyltransferase
MQVPATSKPPAAVADRAYFAGALLLAAYFLATSFYIASHRLFWYDEVFTTMTARMPDWHTIWRALVEENLDPTPFGFFVVARIFDKVFGPGEIAIRIPSVLALAGGMLFTYDCACRLSDRLHGLIAMAALTCSYLPYYGYEGRCYAMYFLFAAAILWAWLGKRSPILLAALFFFGMMIHYYLALCLVPFVAEEALNWRPWSLPSKRLIGSALGALAGLAPLLPQALASRRLYAHSWWAAPRIRGLAETYVEIYPVGLFLLALMTLWILCNERSGTIAVRPGSDAERTAWFSLAIPIAGFAAAVLVTHAFYNRYFMGALPGIAVGFACTMWRRFPNKPRISVGVLLLLAGYGVSNQAIAVAHWQTINEYGPTHSRTEDLLAMEDQFWARGVHYLVFDHPDLRYLEVRYYSKHPERYARWRVPKDPPSKFYPMEVWDLDAVKRHAREIVLLDLHPDRLLMLQQAGLHPRLWKSNDFMFTFLDD